LESGGYAGTGPDTESTGANSEIALEFPGAVIESTEVGDFKVDQQLQRLMKELGQAINESISDSEQIAEVIAKIKSGGYDVFLVLEATIGFNKHEEEETSQSSLVNFRKSEPDFRVSAQDMKFLKSLRISIDHPDKAA
jgi:hypothetical protein